MAKNEIVESVERRVTALSDGHMIDLPKNYSVGNALRSAQLMIEATKDKNNNSVLQTCTKGSIASALLDMVVQGLNPVKKQCYFIAYGNELQLSRSYFGTLAVAKRYAGVDTVNAQVVYEGDKFETKINADGVREIVTHEQPLDSLGGKILGAYAVVVYQSGDREACVMSMSQINDAWNMRRGNGLTKAHRNFPGEMAKKTVINRALKTALNSSSDGQITVSEAYNERPEGDIEAEFDEVVEEQGSAPEQDLSFDPPVPEDESSESGEGTSSKENPDF